MTKPVLTFDGVSVGFKAGGSTLSAVSDVSASVREGEIFGLVGESGCGKTTLALATMGLLPPNANVTGAIRFEGRDLHGLDDDAMRSLRGDRISMVFQDPMTSLDPAFPIGDQVAETIRAHRQVDKRDAKSRSLQLLRDVGIPEPEVRYDEPPHRLSGGMRQRVVIAIALANEPALVIADEPTTALDVTIQSQMLDLLRELRERVGTTIVLITHDLGVVAQVCDRVGVMYSGQLVEVASVQAIFERPTHPYTQALLAALPSADQERGSLRVIEGRVPDLTDLPAGCRFAPRCPHRMLECDEVPPLATETRGHEIACWLSPATRNAAGGHTTVTDGGAA
jgi:peptide/nickel transport system ATP-binding protein